MGRNIGLITVAACAATLAACGTSMDSLEVGGDFASSSGGPGMGATQGGVQDMSFARDLVNQGQVPPPEAFLVEGMFSEHDLPLEGAPCTTTLCLRAAMGVAPNGADEPAAWVQVGMSSTVDPDNFERPSLALVATVDVSGSMGWSYGDDTPGAITHDLLQAIAAELDGEDSVTIVTYGSQVHQALPWVSGDDPGLSNAIAALGEGGSTNMEGGLQLAYQLGQQAIGSADEVRIMLFTDVQPNVGATSATEFETMTASGAEQGVGLTVFGVGLGMGAELMTAMSHLRGGNAFSLTKADDVTPLMEDNWPWLVSPIAYDLAIEASPGDNLQLVTGYGFPVTDGEPTASLEVATVFLSKRKGALLMELAPVNDAPLPGSEVQLRLSYADAQGEPFTQNLTASYDGEPLDDRGVYMPQQGIAKTVSLALLVSGMKDSAEAYAQSHSDAIALLEPVLARFATDANAVGDADLQTEAEFWPKLLELMKAGASQGSLYPGY